MADTPPLDFKKVEALRKHMLLTTSNMAELLDIMTDGWPAPDVIAMEQKYRFQRLLEVMNKTE